MAEFKITNDNFDKVLENAELTLQERRNVNRVGDKIYESAMNAFLKDHESKNNYTDGTQHLADTLTHEIKEDGHYEIGFSKKGKKAYVARLLNDGWEPRNQYGGPYGHAPKKEVEWKDFIHRIGENNDTAMGKAMAEKAKEYMDKKMGAK